MKRKHYMGSDKTTEQLAEIEKKNGASHSASIRIAVDQYFNRIMKDKEGGV